MSRSRRKTPITGNTKAKSEKFFKSYCNRATRTRNKARLKQVREDFLDPKEVSNCWSWPKDGKCFWGRDARERLGTHWYNKLFVWK